MHVGDIEVLPIHGGNFYLDGGAMFGVVPKTLWEKKAPADERNRIRLAANSLLVRARRSRLRERRASDARGVTDQDRRRLPVARLGPAHRAR